MSLIYTSVQSVLVGSKLAAHLMSCGKKEAGWFDSGSGSGD